MTAQQVSMSQKISGGILFLQVFFIENMVCTCGHNQGNFYDPAIQLITEHGTTFEHYHLVHHQHCIQIFTCLMKSV